MKAIAEAFTGLLSQKKIVRVDQCVHFCGYRYGHREINPYEQYAHQLAQNQPTQQVRKNFTEFLRHYRPEHLGDALGIELSIRHPLWHLPWRSLRTINAQPGWVESPTEIVDVMTYFSKQGIPKPQLDREFHWSESAYSRIRQMGYLPRQFSYISVREMRRGGESAYLVLDGNHRLSALSSLGTESVIVKQALGATIHRDRAEEWPLVRQGIMSIQDALKIFDCYFHGNRSPLQSAFAAPVV